MAWSEFVRWKIPVIAWACTILFLTSMPHLEIENVDFDASDKLAHFAVYFIFGYLTIRMFMQGYDLRWRSALIRSTITGIVFAAFDEAHQLLIPGRSAEILDAAADILGVLAAQLVYVLLFWRARGDKNVNILFGPRYEKK